jgi:hypothetical protein
LTPTELFAQHQVVALDSNVLIYLLEGSGPLAGAAEALIDGIEDGEAIGVLASVALTEVLTRPAALGDGVPSRAMPRSSRRSQTCVSSGWTPGPPSTRRGAAVADGTWATPSTSPRRAGPGRRAS